MKLTTTITVQLTMANLVKLIMVTTFQFTMAAMAWLLQCNLALLLQFTYLLVLLTIYHGYYSSTDHGFTVQFSMSYQCFYFGYYHHSYYGVSFIATSVSGNLTILFIAFQYLCCSIQCYFDISVHVSFTLKNVTF